MNDLINRQDAIKSLEKIDLYTEDMVGKLGVLKAILALESLPSAQPSTFANFEPLTPELRAVAKIVINAIIDNTDDDMKKSELREIRNFINRLPNGILVPVRKRGSANER